ncbi:MAG: PLP-dependent decarboxylase, partial [Chloroflexi bacterium]
AATEGLWLHIDAAYGGAAAIVPQMRWVLDGCDRADSLVVNPHKWLFTPVDCSVLLIRHPDWLRAATSLSPHYLTTAEDGAAVNLMDYGYPLGRRFRALKLWFTLRALGLAGARAAIRNHVEWAQELRRRLQANP